MSRVDDLYARARRALADGDAASWEAAEAMAELADRGQTQRQIAAKLGCGQKTVSRYVQVFLESGGLKKRPPFAEALAAVRPPDNTGTRVPRTAEHQAALVAKLLENKAVADAPVVRKQQERHAERRHRQAEKEFREELDIPSRTEAKRERKRLSVVESKYSWLLMLAAVKAATRELSEATGEVERTGLPVSGSGEIVKATRALARAAQRFEEAAASAGIGQAM